MNKNLLTGANILRASLFAFLLGSSTVEAQQNALFFDGTNDYVLTDYTSIEGTGARTVEAWIKTPYSSTQQLIVEWGGGSGNGSRFTFKTQSSHLRIETGGASNYLEGNVNITNNLWHHVAVTYDPSQTPEYKLYVDGVLDVSGSFPAGGTNTSTVSPVQIGARTANIPATVFEGGIDDIRIWNVARTQTEIQANMNTEFCGPQTNLVGYFKFNEGIAGANNTAITTVSDSSGNGYIGTLNGFLLTGTISNFSGGATALTSVIIDDSVTLDGTTLTATEAATGTTYQWIDCDNEDAPIDQATSQTYTPTVNGNYAVIITNGGCSVQSDCMEVIVNTEVCAAPTAVMIADITTDEATVSWTENGDATQWEVLYGPAGFDVETEGETLNVETTAEVTLDELDANTGYDVYVRAVCGEDFTSEWTTVSAFTTLAEVIESNNVAINFDGVNDFVQTTYPGVSSGGARTVEAWIKTTKNSLPTNQGGQGQSVIADWGSTYNGGRFTFNLLFNNAIRLEVAGSGLSGTIAVNDGEWHHVAVVYNPTATNKVALYVDGTLDVEGNVTANTGSATNVRIGARIDNVSFFQGDMDNVRIWNVARTQAELQANMNTEFCGPQTNLKLNLRMNEGVPVADNAGVSLSDNSGNNYLAVFNGFALNGTGSNFVDGLTTITGVTINDEVTLEETTLTAIEAAVGTTYQWVDCDNENAPIDEATAQTYTPTVNGNYAVIITNGGCSVQSDCMEVIINTEVCAAPTAVMIDNITTSSASVSWIETGDAMTWEVVYGPTGFDVETEGETVTVEDTGEVTLDELDANTAYDVYVRAVCGEDFTSEWTAVEDFTTEAVPVCATPSAIGVTEITSSSAMISWTENGDATIWEVLYGPAGFDIETEGETITIDNTPEVMLDELDADTEYDVYVRAVCGEDFASNWESTDSLTTLEEAVCATPSTILITEITSSSAMISWIENGEATIWEVLYGPVGFDIETEGETVTIEDTPEAMLDELDANTEYDVYVRAVCGENFTSNWESTDSFTTLEEAVCITPSDIEITDITSSTAMVSWTENGEATMWEVLYGPAGFDPEIEGETVTVQDTPEVMLDELDPETEYHVYVRAICAEEMVSEWEGQESFTTQTLGLNDNTIAGFAFYPNPTNGALNISAQNNIESVVIYNLTGQKVMAVKVEASASQLDVAKLSEGVYMMHVTSEGKTGVYKLVRK